MFGLKLYVFFIFNFITDPEDDNVVDEKSRERKLYIIVIGLQIFNFLILFKTINFKIF